MYALQGADRELACDAACNGVGTAWEDIGGGTSAVYDLPCELAPWGVDAVRCGLPGEFDPSFCGCSGADCE